MLLCLRDADPLPVLRGSHPLWSRSEPPTHPQPYFNSIPPRSTPSVVLVTPFSPLSVRRNLLGTRPEGDLVPDGGRLGLHRD